MTYYKRVDGIIVDDRSNAMVDPVISHLIRYHCNEWNEEEDLVEFLSCSVQKPQLNVLLRNIGKKEELLVDAMDIDNKRTQSNPLITCWIDFEGNRRIRWHSEEGLTFAKGAIPLTVLECLVGQRLNMLITHPYLPPDLLISQMVTHYDGSTTFHLKIDGE